jgi:hypothetical protein
MSEGGGGTALGGGGTVSGGSGGDLGTAEGGLDAIADGNETCAEAIETVSLPKMDLVLLVDASSSMNESLGTMTKWEEVSTALRAFVGDARSAGLGVGLQFMPQPGPGSSCDSELDCGFLASVTPPACEPVGFCGGGPTSGESLSRCGARYPACAGGAPCLPGGRCAVTGLDCTNTDEPCAGSSPDDLCKGRPKTCDIADDIQGCNSVVYESLAVGIAPLPVPGRQLVTAALAIREPGGTSPLGPAVKGSLAALEADLALHPDRRGLLVIAGDGGKPIECDKGDIAAIVALLSGARNAASRISTYVVGTFLSSDTEARSNLEQLATAGGTGAPLMAAPTQDFAQRFLDRVRDDARRCEFEIPPPKSGPLDLTRVNVDIETSAGIESVPYVGSVALCDPASGGWYYDVDLGEGGTPERVVTCEATCARLYAQGSTVEIRFGCKRADF